MTAPPATILHVISGLGIGGAERALYELLRGGLNDRYGNRVLSLTDAGAYGPRLHDLGIPVDTLDMRRGRPSVGAAARLRRIVAATRPALIQGWMYHGNVAASVTAATLRSRPVVTWNVRTSLNEGAPVRPLVRVSARLSRASRPRAILYNSDRALRQHEAAGFLANGRVMPNGFDIGRWRPDPEAGSQLRDTLSIPARCRVVGYVGRVDPAKNPPNLLAALKSVLAHDPSIHAVVVGRDWDTVVGRDASPRLHLLGQRDDVVALMPGFDLLCLASDYEGFPNVVGEAMACGVPVATTDVGDVAEIVGPTGRVVPIRDPDALAQAILEVSGMEPEARRALGMAARARVVDRYGIDAAVGRYATLYEGLIGS
ncbi:glycosyltransferase [Jannaschia sp. LMIT008]|uniref:glycosyltransferase n=1 Tax=Jannaschia maritima TaxID=3032585 RepID=UPI00281162DB|nr:glycosyltransferase [Jannaschia sp. LMIT008]